MFSLLTGNGTKIGQSEKSRHFQSLVPAVDFFVFRQNLMIHRYTFQLRVQCGSRATAVFRVFHRFVVQECLFTGVHDERCARAC